MSQEFFPINTPLINYFFYPAPSTQDGANVPLAGGFLGFFDDTNHANQLPSYSDVSDPDNPIVNPNPLPLAANGSCPLFYLNNQLYFIQIYDSSMNIIDSINHYNPATGSGQVQSSGNNNLIVNGQFSYPIQFWESTNLTGEVTASETYVAWGWQFLQDENTTTENLITFNPIYNEGVEGDPINELILNSTNIQAGETTKDLRQFLGSVNYLEGQTITFSVQLRSLFAGNALVNILFEKSYGDGGSDSELISVTSFEINSIRSKYNFTYTFPTNASKNMGPNNYCAWRIQYAVGQICSIGTTNIMILPGVVDEPIFTDQNFAQEVSDILGNSTVINNAGLAQNYSNQVYVDGQIIPYANTGDIVLCPINSVQPFRLLCNNASYEVSDYVNNIPLQRLYNVIGNTYGGSGDLIVYSQNNTAYFNSATGAREHSTYTAGTTSFAVSNTVMGLKLGVNAAVLNSNTVQFTWVGNFAPVQAIPANLAFGGYNTALIGNGFLLAGNGTIPNPNPVISTVNVNPGSGSAQAVANIVFNSGNPADYQTKSTWSQGTSKTGNFLEFATQASNARGTYPSPLTALILFNYNGTLFTPDGIGGTYQSAPHFYTGNNIGNMMNALVQTVANPFQWAVTVVSAPSASQYFLFSSATTDYYGWFKVNGSGTDPMIAGRTGVQINISSSDSLNTIASEIAEACNSLTFAVPATTDLPTIPSATKSAWFINL